MSDPDNDDDEHGCEGLYGNGEDYAEGDGEDYAEGDGEDYAEGDGEDYVDEEDQETSNIKEEGKGGSEGEWWKQNSTMYTVGQIDAPTDLNDHIYHVYFNSEYIAYAQPWVLKFPNTSHCMAVYVELTNGKEEKQPPKFGWTKGYCFRILNRIPPAMSIKSFSGAQILFSSAQKECFHANPRRIEGFQYMMSPEHDRALIQSARGIPTLQTPEQHKQFVKYLLDSCRPSVVNCFKDGPFQFVLSKH